MIFCLLRGIRRPLSIPKKEAPLGPPKGGRKAPLGPPQGGKKSLSIPPRGGRVSLGLIGLMGLIGLISLIVEPYGSPKGEEVFVHYSLFIIH